MVAVRRHTFVLCFCFVIVQIGKSVTIRDIIPDSSCERGYIKCADGVQCIFRDFICNGYKDCNDESDEDNCKDVMVAVRRHTFVLCFCFVIVQIGKSVTIRDIIPDSSCERGYIKCADGVQCIFRDFICNGYKDCNDESDEDNCKERECSEDMDKCKSGDQCVYKHWFCNGWPDCPDESDEDPALCNEDRVCPAEMTKCKDNIQCVFAERMCTLYHGCVDGSGDPYVSNSELCPEDRKCPPGMSRCGWSKQCIFDASFCNGVRNCGDTYDESPEFCSSNEAGKRTLTLQ